LAQLVVARMDAPAVGEASGLFEGESAQQCGPFALGSVSRFKPCLTVCAAPHGCPDCRHLRRAQRRGLLRGLHDRPPVGGASRVARSLGCPCLDLRPAHVLAGQCSAWRNRSVDWHATTCLVTLAHLTSDALAADPVVRPVPLGGFAGDGGGFGGECFLAGVAPFHCLTGDLRPSAFVPGVLYPAAFRVVGASDVEQLVVGTVEPIDGCAAGVRCAHFSPPGDSSPSASELSAITMRRTCCRVYPVASQMSFCRTPSVSACRMAAASGR
jgi:hypothetical protein